MEAVARLRNYPSSPRKMRLVADIIRGTSVEKALGVLKFTQKHAARPLEKLLLSAIANWQEKFADRSIDNSDLYIKRVFVDSGKMLKRFRPAPYGRAHRIRKRSHHITIVVASRTTQEEVVVGEIDNQES